MEKLKGIDKPSQIAIHPANVFHHMVVLYNLIQGRIEGGFLRFQETPFDSPIIFKTA